MIGENHMSSIVLFTTKNIEESARWLKDTCDWMNNFFEDIITLPDRTIVRMTLPDILIFAKTEVQARVERSVGLRAVA